MGNFLQAWKQGDGLQRGEKYWEAVRNSTFAQTQLKHIESSTMLSREEKDELLSLPTTRPEYLDAKCVSVSSYASFLVLRYNSRSQVYVAEPGKKGKRGMLSWRLETSRERFRAIPNR